MVEITREACCGLFLAGWLITISLYLLIGVFTFSVPFKSILKICVFLGISIHLHYLICVQVFVVFSYAFYFCKVSRHIATFASDFHFVHLSPLFVVSLVKSVSVVLIFLKTSLWVSLTLSVILLFSSSFIFTLHFIISCLLPALALVCSSLSSSWGCRVGWLIWDVSLCICRHLQLWIYLRSLLWPHNTSFGNIALLFSFVSIF